MKTNILLFILLFLFIGCNKKNTNTYTGTPVPLLKTKWILTSIQNTTTSLITNYPSNGPSEYIIFTDSLNILNIKGSCNNCFSYYSIGNNDSIVTKSGGISTLISCENIQWETDLLNSLGHMYKYKIYGNDLSIYSNGTYNLNLVSQ